MAAITPPALRSIAYKASGSSAGIGSSQGSDGHRVVTPGHSAAGERIERTDAAAIGSDHRPRIGAHPPPRLPDQSAPVVDRNLALLSPGGLVGVAPDSAGTGTLL